jgi:hypothetical protein
MGRFGSLAQAAGQHVVTSEGAGSEGDSVSALVLDMWAEHKVEDSVRAKRVIDDRYGRFALYSTLAFNQQLIEALRQLGTHLQGILANKRNILAALEESHSNRNKGQNIRLGKQEQR